MTTSERPDTRTLELAKALAKEWGTDYVPRQQHSIARLSRMRDDSDVAVVGPREVKLVPADGPPLFFHPSMALVRLKRLLEGGIDTLVEISGTRPGDVVLDCTAGLCADALVFSFAVGPQGRVVALEASPIVHAIVREGLKLYDTGLPEVDRAMRAVRPVLASYESYLKQQEDDSVDIVYFDPMFERPVDASSSLEPLRARAHMGPLTDEAVSEARRVARRSIVLKDHRGSGQFERLGFRQARKSGSSVAYGVITIGD
ncbi:class I SAM-dependent methyltransferase [Cohnella sp. GCM10027633]|uniref:class I SAM-dependent methyltransferase n=1 Tax=unclassified Cohnella TaxID=2636738 RepID=UPI00363F645A